jgi:hypothetical protein
LAEEVVALARVALARLELTSEPVEVLLGGGLLQSAAGDLLESIRKGVLAVAPNSTVRPTATPAIVGAALLGLDDLGAGREAQNRLRHELAAAFSSVEGVTSGG